MHDNPRDMIDFSTIFEFQDLDPPITFGISLATLLQCLCIAEQRNFVPAFEESWESVTIPAKLREWSQTRTRP